MIKNKMTSISVNFGTDISIKIKISNDIMCKIIKMFYNYEIVSCEKVDLVIQKINSKIVLINNEGNVLESFSINDDTMLFKILTYIEDIVVEKTPFIALHGSAIRKEDYAIIFCGSSNSGKTTIALDMLLDNPEYSLISDDVLFIKNNFITGLNLPIKLRKDVYLKYSSLINNYLTGKRIKTKSDIGEERILYLPDKKPNSIMTRIKAIVFPNYNNKLYNNFYIINGSTKVNKLIKNTRKHISLPTLYASYTSLSKSIPMYKLDYNDSNFAKENIKRIEKINSI